MWLLWSLGVFLPLPGLARAAEWVDHGYPELRRLRRARGGSGDQRHLSHGQNSVTGKLDRRSFDHGSLRRFQRNQIRGVYISVCIYIYKIYIYIYIYAFCIRNRAHDFGNILCILDLSEDPTRRTAPNFGL